MRLFAIDLGGKIVPKYHVAITGFRECSTGSVMANLPAKLRAFEDGSKVLAAQVFDPSRVATHVHLLASTIYALQSFKESREISRTLATETLLYSSAQRQIDWAIEMLGYRPTSSNIALVVIGSHQDDVVDTIRRIGEMLGGVEDDNLLNVRSPEKTENIKKLFKVNELEMKSAEIGTSLSDRESTITKRILSRISMMAIAK